MKKVLPNLHDDGYAFVSGIESHREAPKTFWIPSEEEKVKVGRGTLVKLNFDIRTADKDGQDQMNGERMWVIVVERDGDWFSGILDNQPTCTDDMKPGMIVHFNSEHIINIGDMNLDLESEKYQEYREAMEKALSEKD